MISLGVDVGGTNIAAGLVDESLRITARLSAPTGAEGGAAAVVRRVGDVIDELLRRAAVPVDFIGVGVPGTVTTEGLVVFAGNLGFHFTDLGGALRERFGRPVAVLNDANAAALGEYAARAAAGFVGDFALITLGTGVGGGAVIGGKLLTGHNGAALEVGHMAIEAGGIPCNCGRRGCFEKYASATALCDAARIAGLAPKLPREFGAREVFALSDSGDDTARRVTDDYLRWLGIGVTNVVNLLQPQVIALGGGVAERGEPLLQAVQEYVKANDFARECEATVTIEKAILGADAGIGGAAMAGL